MAVIIENMSMPDGCEDCPLAYLADDDGLTTRCSFTMSYVTGFYTERANDCPLREGEKE